MDYPERLLESLPIIALMRKDSLARIAPADTAIGPPSTTARRRGSCRRMAIDRTTPTDLTDGVVFRFTASASRVKSRPQGRVRTPEVGENYR